MPQEEEVNLRQSLTKILNNNHHMTTSSSSHLTTTSITSPSHNTQRQFEIRCAFFDIFVSLFHNYRRVSFDTINLKKREKR